MVSAPIGIGSSADVVFAVDSSIKDHSLVKISNLIRGALEQYPVSSTNVRAALVQFGENIDTLHRMENPDKTELYQKLSSLSFSKSDRNIPVALRDIASNVFAKSPRADAKLKIFMFVAGPTDGLEESQVNAVATELKKRSIDVQFVYMGDHSSESLMPFVKSENHIMHIAPSHEIPFALDPILKMDGVRQGKKYFGRSL